MLAAFTLVVMRPWDPSATNMTIGLLRTAVGPLLGLYFDARRRLVRAQALEELRDLVGILRTAPEGDPALASPVVGRTAYRVLREALTNVRKHAPGARVRVRVEYDTAQVRLTVHNTPPAGSPRSALAGTGSGPGIAHLRQRIELVHGTLRAEPCSDGGFSVEATLPAFVPTAESFAPTAASAG